MSSGDGDSTRVLRSADDIDALAPSWRSLIGRTGYAISDPEWYSSAARRTLGADDRLAIVTVWRGGCLVAIAPLLEVRSGGYHRLEILGARTLYEPAEVLAIDADAVARLADALVRMRTPMFLARIPASSDFIAALAGRARGAGVLLAPRGSGSPYIELDGDWARYHADLPSRTRNILKRAFRALGRRGDLQFEFVTPTPGDAARVLNEAFHVELQSWKGRRGSAVLQRPDLHGFFLAYGEAAAARGELLVAFLRLDGRAIAMQVANVGRNAYRQLKIGYDDREARYLPGLQLLSETIRWSNVQGLGSYEFLGVREDWTRDWTGTVREHRAVAYYPFNTSGARAFLGDGIVRVLGRIRRRGSVMPRVGAVEGAGMAQTGSASQAGTVSSDTISANH